MSRVQQVTDKAALRSVANDSRPLNVMVSRKAHDINRAAATAFRTRQIISNEMDMSQTTPPKYIREFRVRKIQRAKSYSWIALNEDPAAEWVEYGAHAGGRTLVLRYRPYTIALEKVAMAG